MKKWEISPIREQKRDEIRALASSLGVNELTGALLFARGLKTREKAQEFISKKTEAFYDPFLMKDMTEAVNCLLGAVRDRKKIVIYGDYDVDGVTSVSVLCLYLQSIGADVDYYIPSRAEEGYGMNTSALDRLAEDGVSLIITVDTGITAAEEIEYARSLGVDVIVTDHHACHTDLPKAIAVVNPHRPDCPYPFKELAGVGVVFKLVCAIEKRLCDERGQGGAQYLISVCSRYADLVAIGTVADVMPLCEENRLIVSIGLALMEKNERMGLRALMEAASTSDKKPKITSSYIGFTIAPRINAAGRLGSAARAARLFLTDDEEEAKTIACELCDTNKERQHEENEIIEQAMDIISREQSEEDEVIVLARDGWHQGVIGIVASRLTERYGKPAILITFDGDTGKGSGRSVKGINLVEALSACSEHLERFGGHELAAGLTVKREDLDAFREAINLFVKEHRAHEYVDLLNIDCEIYPREITVASAGEVSCLEPYGTGNPEPVFALMGATIADAKQIGGGKHTRFVLERDGIRCDAVWFNCNLMQTNFYVGDTVDAACRLSINEYMNIQSAQLIITELRLCGRSAADMDKGRELYEQSKDGHKISDEEDIIPEHDDFAAVYRYIKSEVRRENDIIGAKGISRRIDGVNYAKARYIIDIFREVNIVGIENFGPEPDIYKFKLKPQTTKVNLDKSSIYKRLKSRKEYK